MRFVIKFLSVIFFLIVFSLVYLSIFGIETNKFNNQILNKVERINKDIKFELKKIKIVLNPFSFRLQAKTIGPKLIDVRSNNIIITKILIHTHDDCIKLVFLHFCCLLH